MELTDITMDGIMTYNARNYAEELAFEYDDYRFTWVDLDKITDHIASGFLEDGITKGTHVGIFSTNSPNWICTYIALAKIGAVSVLLHFDFKAQELDDIMRETDVQYLCYGDGYKDCDYSEIIQYLKERREFQSNQFISIGRDDSGAWYQVSDFPYRKADCYEKLLRYKCRVKSNDNLSMILTSGTTARPKGVLLTHFQMFNVAYETAGQMHWDRTDKICLSLSLFHCFGLSAGLLASLAAGCSICLLPSFRSRQVLEAIKNHHCTILNGVPSMFLAIIENPDFCTYDLHSLKSGILAGSGIRKQDYFKIKEHFKIPYLQQSFGQTECSPSITFSGYDDPVELKAVSVGKAISNISIRIVSETEGYKKAPAFEEGEIQIKGYNVMTQGYYRREDLTKQAFTEDGWLRTGDIGHVDKEGNLYITGRKKDIIIRCGVNISPKEIEEIMLSYCGMKDVKVFGVPAPVVQEEIAACFLYEGEFHEDDFRAYMKTKAAAYKIPKYFYQFKQFPLLPNGKINKKELQNLITK